MKLHPNRCFSEEIEKIMAKPLAVLLVEDSEDDAQLIIRVFETRRISISRFKRVDTAETMKSHLLSGHGT